MKSSSVNHICNQIDPVLTACIRLSCDLIIPTHGECIQCNERQFEANLPPPVFPYLRSMCRHKLGNPLPKFIKNSQRLGIHLALAERRQRLGNEIFLCYIIWCSFWARFSATALPYGTTYSGCLKNGRLLEAKEEKIPFRACATEWDQLADGQRPVSRRKSGEGFLREGTVTTIWKSLT